MYGYRDKMVFCKLHPHKRCEHFCEFHTVLLCSICLREKHRNCKILEDHEFKSFYGQKVRDAGKEIETEKHALLENTDGIAHALETGITRLGSYRKELDEVINRMADMRNEVDHQRHEIRNTSQALSDIERSVSTANELKDCKKLFASVDTEKEKFERRQQKVLQMPSRFRDDITNSISNLQRKLKNIRSSLATQLNSVHLKQQYAGSPIPNKDKYQSLPYFDIREKNINKHSIDTRFMYLDKGGRDSRRSVLDDGRQSRQSRLKLSLKLPQLLSRPSRHDQQLDHVINV
ncbi:uncharacterized protein LOC128550545 [Mercenaria mercenaria]|uniref:uncharacterized protein LOC128550545 n=1 Tax=Mercenaria mercenaria TaxID=6596 RepID=UPI00234E5A68|nr:uncharacterized protein LOC128550545 [Mercenaria mercenaria]